MILYWIIKSVQMISKSHHEAHEATQRRKKNLSCLLKYKQIGKDILVLKFDGPLSAFPYH